MVRGELGVKKGEMFPVEKDKRVCGEEVTQGEEDCDCAKGVFGVEEEEGRVFFPERERDNPKTLLLRMLCWCSTLTDKKSLGMP